jgi:hypothetical protein
MARRTELKGVLHGLLGTFTSRYADCDGYWICGLLVAHIDRALEIDLLSLPEEELLRSPMSAATLHARLSFAEQLEKVGIPRPWVREAVLEIARRPGRRDERASWNGPMRSGHTYRFAAHALSDLGRRFEAEVRIFVAPHDPQLESRRAPHQRLYPGSLSPAPPADAVQ